MDKQLLSIIIPVYKAEKSLARCIESVLSQSFVDWEMILVDDGSPDNSGIICDEYALKDSRIMALHKENGGPSSARNLGLEQAKGKYIWFVDADDWIEPLSLSVIFHAIEGNDADICFFGLNSISTSNVSSPYDLKQIVGDIQGFVKYNGKDECGEAISRLEIIGGMGWTWNKWFKNSIIQKYQIRFDRRFAIQEDHLFTLNYLLHVNSILLTSLAPYNYVMSGGSLLTRTYPYLNTKARNAAMYQSRLMLCNAFGISDSGYLQWLETDYATRTIANLLQMKNSDLSIDERKKEVKSTNMFLTKHSVNLKGPYRYYRLFKWMPSSVIVWFLSK